MRAGVFRRASPEQGAATGGGQTAASSVRRLGRLGSGLAIVAVAGATALLTLALNIKLFAVLLALVVAVWMLRDPRTAFWVTLASLSSGYMWYVGNMAAVIPISVPKLCGAVVVLALLGQCLLYRRALDVPGEAWFPVPFIVLSLVSVAYSPFPVATLKTSAQLVGSFSLYFLALCVVRSRPTFMTSLRVLVVAFTLVGIYCLFQYYVVGSHWTDEYRMQKGMVYEAFVDRGIKRSSGASHPGVISFIYNMLIPYIVYLFKVSRTRWTRVAYGLSFCICVAALLLTHTRVAFLGLGLLFVFLYVKGVFRIPVPVLVLLILFGGVAMFALLPATFAERVLSFGSYMAEGSVRIRLENQSHAWRFFTEAPLLGTGAGTFEQLSPVARPVNKEVTNMALEFLAELGIVGFAAGGIFLVVIVRKCVGIERYFQTRAGCNLGVIVSASVFVSLFSSLFMSCQDFREWWLFMSFPFLVGRLFCTKPEEALVT